jgi:hypothetical protein
MLPVKVRQQAEYRLYMFVLAAALGAELFKEQGSNQLY